MTSQLTKKENQLRKQEEILGENLEEAERHLLAQKQSLEKELARKQRELQEVAQILSKKKANISEAVNILQVIQGEKYFFLFTQFLTGKVCPNWDTN